MITIIPAIDIIDGKCVRLTQGDFNTKKVYGNDPLIIARRFEDLGIKRLHMVDLDGTREKHIVNHAVLQKVAQKTSLSIDFGGGVQSEEDVRIALDSGAKQITAGSIAVRDENLVKSWIEKFGQENIILGADIRNGKIAVSGWQEQTELDLNFFLGKYIASGIKYTICTDISRDGLLQGPATDLYRSVKTDFYDLYLIASGGVSSVDDLNALNHAGIDGVIIGKALYEGRIKFEELKSFLC
jgi:phosphoribosylformimino-5-aminoimidazole carboxamide ribotide isomerase